MFLSKKTEAARKDAINKMIKNLLLAKDSSVNVLFNKLCLYVENKDIETIYCNLSGQADTFCIYWLVKYIVQIQKPYALDKLFELSQNQSLIIRQESRVGIKNLEKKHKINILLRLLEKTWEDNIVFAIKQLGELRVPKAVFPLISILKKHGNSDQINISALKALGELRDKSSMPILEKFADKEEGRIQEQALGSLSKFNEILDEKYIVKWLHSENLRIKEFIFLKILRRSNKKWEKYIVQGLRKERNDALKQSILTSIRNIQTLQLFNAIYNLALNDKSYRLRMLAQTLLKKIKAKKSASWIIKKWPKSNNHDKCFILRVLSYYPDEPNVFNLYKKMILKPPSLSSNKNLKLIAIEYLGRLKNTKNLSILLDIIKNDNEYDYAAAIALSNLITPSKWECIKEVLTLNTQNKELCIIVFLKFILRLPLDYQIPNFIEKMLENFSTCESEHIRHLSTRCLLHTTKSDKLYQFLKIARLDQSKKVRCAALESIIDFLNYRPQDMISFLSMGIHNPPVMPIVHKAFRDVVRSENNYDPILRVLLKLICKKIKDNGNRMDINAYRLMIFLKHHAISQKSIFINILLKNNWKDVELWILMMVINSTDIKHLRGICIDAMADQYRKSSPRTKKEYLKFFKHMNATSRAVEKVVFDDLSQSQDHALSNNISETTSFWLTNSFT